MILLAWLPAIIVGLLTAHTCVNAVLLRRPRSDPSPVDYPVAVLVPARDEATRLPACLTALCRQDGVPQLEIIVLDDGSTDGTAQVIRTAAQRDPRVRLISGTPPPAGWLGKPHACRQLAEATRAPVLIYVDADVVVAPTAVAAACGLLDGFDLVSPYPRIVGAGRLVQPLLGWSWLTFLPLRLMERPGPASLSAAGGQFLVVRRTAYERAGGHGAVRDRVLEDVELARFVKRTGGRVALADGSGLATCRMYDSWAELVAGYTKSLWAAFGTRAGAAVVVALLSLLYVVPAVVGVVAAIACLWQPAAWPWAIAGLTAYAAGVVGRVVATSVTGARRWPDALAQPVSIVIFGWLVARSYRLRRSGDLRWKGRPVVAGRLD